MSAWTWVLVGLCALGIVLAVAPVFSVLRLALRLRSRLNDLQKARLFTSIESLNLQRAHLESTAANAAPLAARAQAAVESMKKSAQESGFHEMRDAMQTAGAQIRSAVEALR